MLFFDNVFMKQKLSSHLTSLLHQSQSCEVNYINSLNPSTSFFLLLKTYVSTKVHIWKISVFQDTCFLHQYVNMVSSYIFRYIMRSKKYVSDYERCLHVLDQKEKVLVLFSNPSITQKKRYLGKKTAKPSIMLLNNKPNQLLSS